MDATTWRMQQQQSVSSVPVNSTGGNWPRPLAAAYASGPPQRVDPQLREKILSLLIENVSTLQKLSLAGRHGEYGKSREMLLQVQLNMNTIHSVVGQVAATRTAAPPSVSMMSMTSGTAVGSSSSFSSFAAKPSRPLRAVGPPVSSGPPPQRAAFGFSAPFGYNSRPLHPPSDPSQSIVRYPAAPAGSSTSSQLPQRIINMQQLQPAFTPGMAPSAIALSTRPTNISSIGGTGTTRSDVFPLRHSRPPVMSASSYPSVARVTSLYHRITPPQQTPGQVPPSSATPPPPRWEPPFSKSSGGPPSHS